MQARGGDKVEQDKESEDVCRQVAKAINTHPISSVEGHEDTQEEGAAMRQPAHLKWLLTSTPEEEEEKQRPQHQPPPSTTLATTIHDANNQRQLSVSQEELYLLFLSRLVSFLKICLGQFMSSSPTFSLFLSAVSRQ